MEIFSKNERKDIRNIALIILIVFPIILVLSEKNPHRTWKSHESYPSYGPPIAEYTIEVTTKEISYPDYVSETYHLVAGLERKGNTAEYKAATTNIDSLISAMKDDENIKDAKKIKKN